LNVSIYAIICIYYRNQLTSIKNHQKEKEKRIMEEKKVVAKENLDKVAGGGDFGKCCPNCGSSDVRFLYEHDEIGVFSCPKCGNVQIPY
jgi:predicted RNA-binding Zn-ribbon protein involved in translation (DUF1610 family)